MWSIRILERGAKWIRITLLIQIPQRMINLPMLRLIRPNIIQQLPHAPLPLGHPPIIDRQIRGLKLLPLRQPSRLQVCNLPRVRHHGLFLEIADEAVAGLGGDKVGEEEGVEIHALRAEDEDAHERAGLGELEEGEEVHAFVVGFFEESFDPGGGLLVVGEG